MAAHTYIGECGQKVPWLKKGLQRESNLQLFESLQLIPTLTMNSNQLTEYTQQIE